MTDYEQLVKALRHCGKDLMSGERCKDSCPYGDIALCLPKLKLDAAAAIEELQQIADHYEQTAKDYWKEACDYKAQLPKRGEWVGIEYDGYADGNPVYDVWECSECGEEHEGEEDTLTNYCPNCGAKMEVQDGQ